MLRLLLLILFPLTLLSPPESPELIIPAGENPVITLPMVMECIKKEGEQLHLEILQDERVIYEAHYLDGCYHTFNYLPPGNYRMVLYSSGGTPETFSPGNSYPITIPEQHHPDVDGCNFSYQ